MNYLKTHISLPLEREFEAWIVDGIERYFTAIGWPFQVVAVSPAREKAWPADVAMEVYGSVVGLQFKRPNLAKRTRGHSLNDFSRLSWGFAMPPGQMVSVHAQQEIYYCLPTFTNRLLKHQALHHCLFWRPPSTSDLNAWYENRAHNVKTTHSILCNEARWGLFAERIVSGQVGARLTGQRFSDYVAGLRDADPISPPSTYDWAATTYFLISYDQ